MTLSALGTIAVVLILAWTLGGVALRLGGALVFWAGLLGLLVTGDPQAIPVALVGALAWLGGQGHHALRHQGVAKSPLARSLFAAAAALWHRLWRVVQERQAAAENGQEHREIERTNR